MIRDRPVIGIRDKNLSERLQLEPDLILQKTEKLIRQRQAVQEQQLTLKSSSTVAPKKELDGVKRHNFRHQKSKKSMRSQKPPDSQPSWYPPKCRRCGKGSHPRQHCPARDSICHRCDRKGHYAPQCLSKTVAELVSFMEELTTSDQDSDNDFHSDALYLNTVSEQQADT